MPSQIDQAYTTTISIFPRNLAEQKVIWRKKLREELEYEKGDVGTLYNSLASLVIFEEEIKKYNQLQEYIDSHAYSLGFVFFSAHRIAYFDGILEGTGISKDASQPPPEYY